MVDITGEIEGVSVRMRFVPFGRWDRFLIWLFPRQYDPFLDCEIKFVQEELTLE